MLRVVVASLALLAAGTAAAKPGDPNPPRLGPDTWEAGKVWIEEYIQQRDWLFAGFAGRQFWFASSLPADKSNYPIVRDWVRSEAAHDEKGSRSFLWNVEVDCEKWRYRVTESYWYSQNNLRGRFHGGQDVPEDWNETRPTAVMRDVLRTICQGPRA